MGYTGQTVPDSAVVHQSFWSLDEVLSMTTGSNVQVRMEMLDDVWKEFLTDLDSVERTHYDRFAGDRYESLIEVGDMNDKLGLWVNIYDNHLYQEEVVTGGFCMLNDASEFKFLTGDVNWEIYGGKWVSKKLNNGDFAYWLVIEFMNWIDTSGSAQAGNEFNVQVSAYSPERASDEAMKSALSSCGFSSPDGLSEMALLIVLAGTGVGPTLYSANGNDADALLQQAKVEGVKVSSLIGFYLDEPQNVLGSTGWDILAGQPLAALHRRREEKREKYEQHNE